MGKKLKKLKPTDKTVGQYSQGGNNKNVPIWPTIYKQTPEEEMPTEKVQRFVYRWTFTINWGEVLFWTALFLTIYLLR